MGMYRRKFIQGVGGAALLGLFPHAVAAEWSRAAFEAKSIDEALNALLAQTETLESDDIAIDVPDIAEDGKVVPIKIGISLPGVKSLAVIVEKNPIPLVAAFKFGDNGATYVSTRIKMNTTSDVVVVIESAGKLYTAKKEIKVTVGGC